MKINQPSQSKKTKPNQSQFQMRKQLTPLAGREIATSLRASQGRGGMKQDGLRSFDKPAAAGKLRTSFGICDRVIMICLGLPAIVWAGLPRPTYSAMLRYEWQIGFC
jgi:hypothetical protein